MDKRCKDCQYKGYAEHDVNETWPFCLCVDKELRKVATEWLNHIHKYHIKFNLEKKMNELPEGNVPSCQLVQAAYFELYSKSCPNYVSK